MKKARSIVAFLMAAAMLAATAPLRVLPRRKDPPLLLRLLRAATARLMTLCSGIWPGAEKITLRLWRTSCRLR